MSTSEQSPRQVKVAAFEAAATVVGGNVPYAGLPSASINLGESRQKKGEVSRGASPAPWAEHREVNMPFAAKRQASPPRPDADSVGMAYLANGLTKESATTSLQRQFAHGGVRARVVPPKADTSLLTPQELNREAPETGKKMFTRAPDANPILLGLEAPRERRGMPYFSPRDMEGRAGYSPRRSLSQQRSPREAPADKQETASVTSGDAVRATPNARAMSREAPHRLSSGLAGVLDPTREAATCPETPKRERSPRSISRARQLNLLSGHAMEGAMRGYSPENRLSGSLERPRSLFAKDEELNTTVRETRRRTTPQPRMAHGLENGLCQEAPDDFAQLGISRKGRVSPKGDRQRHPGLAPWDHAAENRRGKMSLSPPRQAPLTDIRPSVRAPFATDEHQVDKDRPPSVSLRLPRDRELVDLPRRARSPSVRETGLWDKTQPFGTEADVPSLSSKPARQSDVVIRPLFRDKESEAVSRSLADGAAGLAALEAAVVKVQDVNVEAGAVARAAVQRARADLEEAMGTALRCLSPERAGPALSLLPLDRNYSPRPSTRQVDEALTDLLGSPRGSPPSSRQILRANARAAQEMLANAAPKPSASPRPASELQPTPKQSPEISPRSVLHSARPGSYERSQSVA